MKWNSISAGEKWEGSCSRYRMRRGCHARGGKRKCGGGRGSGFYRFLINFVWHATTWNTFRLLMWQLTGWGGGEGCRPCLWGWIIIEFCKRLTWTENAKVSSGGSCHVMACPARGLWKEFIFKYEIELSNERCKLTCDDRQMKSLYISLLFLLSPSLSTPLSLQFLPLSPSA